MQKELDLILQQMPECKEITVGDIAVYSGKIGDKDIVACKCGIGKVNSALRTSKVIEEFHPDLIINTGVAGSLDESMEIGSILVADRATYHDVWCPGNEYGAVDGMPVFYKVYAPGVAKVAEIQPEIDVPMHTGLICSGDIFISKPTEVIQIKSHFPDGLACDMESASIAQTCYIHDIPFLIIRVMSDMPGGGHNVSEYKDFWIDAPVKTFGVVSKFIQSLHSIPSPSGANEV